MIHAPHKKAPTYRVTHGRLGQREKVGGAWGGGGPSSARRMLGLRFLVWRMELPSILLLGRGSAQMPPPRALSAVQLRKMFSEVHTDNRRRRFVPVVSFAEGVCSL